MFRLIAWWRRRRRLRELQELVEDLRWFAYEDGRREAQAMLFQVARALECDQCRRRFVRRGRQPR